MAALVTDPLRDEAGPERRRAGSGNAGASRGKPLLWLGLASLVLVASVAVVLALDRTGSAPGSLAAPLSSDGGRAQASDGETSFLPPGVVLPRDERLADRALRVRAPRDWDVARVVTSYDEAQKRFVELLRMARHDPRVEVPVLPLTVAIVPQRVFCDARVYETEKVPADCASLGAMYRLREQTVLVADDIAHLDDNMAYGIALARCLQTSMPGCEDAIDRVDAEIEERRAGEAREARDPGGPGGATPKRGKRSKPGKHDEQGKGRERQE